MNKILPMMIISVCMYGQVCSSEPLIDREQQQDAKLTRLRNQHHLTFLEDRITVVNQLLREDDYSLALRILHNFSSFENISECKSVEKELDAKEASLSLAMVKANTKEQKEEIQKNHERLKIISTFVLKQKLKAKEADERNRENEKFSKTITQPQNIYCAVQ